MNNLNSSVSFIDIKIVADGRFDSSLMGDVCKGKFQSSLTVMPLTG
jgi:hypothetical protein